MTISASINARELNARLNNLEACAEHAPAGTYEDAKACARVVDALGAAIFGTLHAAGLNPSNCDGAREIEAVIYGMIRAQNPGRFDVAEAFGDACADPVERAALVADSERLRDNLKALEASRNGDA